MATTTTSIHRANDRDGFSVSFQIDHTIGADNALLIAMHTSPGRARTVELDVPLSEFPELIKSLQMILDETPLPDQWCKNCNGSGEVPALNGMGFPHMRDTCPVCHGKGMAT